MTAPVQRPAEGWEAPEEAIKRLWCEIAFIQDTGISGLRADVSCADLIAVLEHNQHLTNAAAPVPPPADERPDFPLVERIEMVDYSEGYKQPAEPMWRVRVGERCADFETRTGAENFRSEIAALISPPPADEGMVEAMARAHEDAERARFNFAPLDDDGWAKLRETLLPAMRAALALYLPPAPLSPAGQPAGSPLADIGAERRRQIEVEGWTPEHDDAEHRGGDLAVAAAAWAHVQEITMAWGEALDKRSKPRRRQLVIAGALIVAEIERLDRLALPSPPSEPGQ